MKINQTSFLLIFLLIVQTGMSTVIARNQPGEHVRVTTHDENVLTGVIIQENEEEIVLRVEGIGDVTIQRSNIKSMEIIESDRMRNGKYWFENPQGTRYFFAPNALGLNKGSGYYQNTWIFFNNVNYGVSDHVSIGAGMVPLFLLGEFNLPLWLLPKVSIPVSTDNIHVGAGALLGGVVGVDGGGFGIVYGNTTFGNRDKNLTLGLGYGYAGTEWSNTPLVNISGLIRTGQKFYWLAEVYFLPGIEGSGFGIFGARWAPERFAVDFGLARPVTEAGGIIGVPRLGITIPFGN